MMIRGVSCPAAAVCVMQQRIRPIIPDMTHLPRLAGLLTALLLCAPWGTTLAQGMLWQAQRGQSLIFLYASVHVCDAGCYPFAPAVQQALQISQVLAVELDPEREDISQKISQRGFYPPGQSLRPLFTPEQYKRLEEVFSSQYNKRLETLLHMRPWLFQTALSIYAAEKVGLDSSLGVDLKLMQQARALKKPIRPLETLDEQLQMLELLAAQDPAGQMKQLAEQFESGLLGIQLSNLVVVWKRGDAQRLSSMLDALQTDAEKQPAFQNELRLRNQRMTQRMLQLLQEYRTVMVVVGAAYYFEPGSLLTLLQQQGFEIRRLPTDRPTPAK